MVKEIPFARKSGDMLLVFSTGNVFGEKVEIENQSESFDRNYDNLSFENDATEGVIFNAMIAMDDMTRIYGNKIFVLFHEQLIGILINYEFHIMENK